MIPRMTWALLEDTSGPLHIFHPSRRDYEHDSVAPHSHEFWELVLILSGTGMHVTKRQRYPVVAGDVFLIRPRQVHGYEEKKDLRLINILFDKKRLSLPLYDIREMPGFHTVFTLTPKRRVQDDGKSFLHLSAEALGHVEALVDSLEHELRERAPGFQFMASTLFMQILGHLCRCFSEEEAHDSQSLLRLGRVICHIEGNYAEAISLKDLCSIAHMSNSTLLRHFHRALGCSPMDYLVRFRITKASELLRQTRLSTTQVAFQVGFSDSNYFSRQFRRVMGCSPREFRKRFPLPG